MCSFIWQHLGILQSGKAAQIALWKVELQLHQGSVILPLQLLDGVSGRPAAELGMQKDVHAGTDACCAVQETLRM